MAPQESTFLKHLQTKYFTFSKTNVRQSNIITHLHLCLCIIQQLNIRMIYIVSGLTSRLQIGKLL